MNTDNAYDSEELELNENQEHLDINSSGAESYENGAEVCEDESNTESDGEDYGESEENKSKSLLWSVAAIFFGIVSVFLSIFGLPAIINGALSVALSFVSRKRLGFFDGKSISGMILGIFGLVFGIAEVIFSALT